MPIPVLPYPAFPPDTDADGSQVIADLAALIAVLVSLDDLNIAPLANIDGNKLSPESGKQVPESRLATGAVSSRVLAVASVIAEKLAPGSVTAAAISALTITAAQIAANTIGKDKLKMTVQSVAFSFGGIGVDDVIPTTPIPTASSTVLGLYYGATFAINGGIGLAIPWLGVSGANYIGKIRHDVTTVSGTLVFVSIGNT